MGSSSVSCAMTGVSLCDREAVLIPLVPQVNTNRRSPSTNGGASYVSGDGAAGLYSLLALPLFGRVGCYGELESVTDDENSRFLREKFGDHFDDFVESSAYGGPSHTVSGKEIPAIARAMRTVNRIRIDSGHTKRDSWDGTISGCWISREAWDAFACETPDGSSVWSGGSIDKFNLELLGFTGRPCSVEEAVASGANLDGDGSLTRYTHPKLPGVIAWSDGKHSSDVTYNGKQLCCYTFRSLATELRALGVRFPDGLRKVALAHSRYEEMLAEELLRIKLWIEINKSMRMCSKSDPEAAERVAGHCSSRPVSIDAPQEYLDSFERDILNGMPAKPSNDPFTMEICVPNNIGSAWHVTVRGNDLTSDPEDSDVASVVACPSGRRRGCGKRHNFSCHYRWSESQAVRNALAMVDWKRYDPPRSAYLDATHFRCFSPEFRLIYKTKFLREPLLRRTIEVLHLIDNMHAANRLLAPTSRGMQSGDFRTQLRVAELAASMCRKSLRAR